MRLRPAIGDRPKVLAPVAGRPFLAYLLDQLAAANVHTAVLCTGYLGEHVRSTFGDCYGTVGLTYSQEPTPLGTAGALRLALPLLDGDPVLVLNGDSYCEVDLGDYMAWHHIHAGGSAGTLLLTWVEDASRFGTVEVDDSGTVLSFREKRGLAMPGWINAGVYLLSQRLLASIPAERTISLERDVFPAWTKRELRAHQVRACFTDIGTPESYVQAEAFLAGRARPAFQDVGRG
jgi:D-glycero-alpha-D-manno-heptose 1-phosphate guanylyltransferase